MSGLSVSFIVPCYCTEKQLLMRCLRSILALGDNLDFEIQLIDDGTPQSQVESWVKEIGDNRISYHYQENTGLSGARNAGIGLASKEYVQFVDSDDYLFAGQYRRCLELLEKYSPDLLKFDMKEVYSLEPDAFSYDDGRCAVYESGAEYMLQKSLFAAAWSYLVKRDVVADKRFVPGILHEDEEFTPRLLLDCGKTIVTKLAPYAYYQRDDSIISNRDEGHLDRRFSDLLKVYDYLKDYRKTLDGGKLAALSRRIDQLGESFVYELIRLSPDKCFLDRWLIRVKESGVYPLSVRWYNWKYALFCGLTCRMWMVRFLYCVNKILRLL